MRPTRTWLLLALAGAGCDLPNPVNPVWIYREVSGRNDEGRPPPPGLDLPRPNLASVPPRPERPTAATRAALDNSLAADRAASRQPLAPRADAPPAAAIAPGDPPVPAAPPPPPALAAAARVPWVEAPARSGTPAARAGAPAPAPPALPSLPDAPPPPPPPDLLAPPRPR